MARTDRRMLRHYAQWFDEIGIDDVPLVGGKNASLGEMYRELASDGVKVPNGFAITARHIATSCERQALTRKSKTSYATSIRAISTTCGSRDPRLGMRSCSAEIPASLDEMIVEAYAELSTDAVHPLDVAVRSSATAEDLPDASFAGQQETYLNVQGRTSAAAHVSTLLRFSLY